MAQYLEKFQGVIGQRQTEQIFKLLNKKRNTGQIRTMEEFSTQVEELVRDLTSTTLQPSLRLWLAEMDASIDSESWNFMLDRVQDDLESAFEEALKIDEVQKSHEAIVRDVTLKNLRAGVAELESKVDLYEFLNKDLRGFDAAIFSTFRESKDGRTQRGVALTSVIFADPRTGELVPVAQDAEVELVGERLILANQVKTVHNIRAIRQVFDSTSPQSELLVEPPGTSITNIIDNQTGTYWLQSLLFAEDKEFVKVQLELDLGVVQEVNFIDIEPASRYGLILEAVDFADGNNVITPLLAKDVPVDSDISLRVRKTATNRLILTFRNENSRCVQFEYSENADSLFLQALAEPPEGLAPSRTGTGKDLDDLLASIKIKELVGIKNPDLLNFTGFEFLTGLDNIRVGLTTHSPRAIYVSSSLEVCGAGELGLKTLESRPYIDKATQKIEFTNTTYDIAVDADLVTDGPTERPSDPTLLAGEISNTFFQGSIEYWIVKQDLSEAGTLLQTSVFPILPLGVERVYHERLILTEKSISTLVDNDIGSFVFFTNRTDGDIKVYRNGELLVDDTGALVGGGWKQEPDPVLVPGAGVDQRTPNNGNRMIFKIKVLDQLPGDIFTVSYLPLTSSTRSIPKSLNVFDTQGGLQVVDLVGDLSARSETTQIVILDRIGEDDVSLTSRIFLVIILRQNTAEPTLTSAVEEYTLTAGCKDPTKFEEI